MMILLIEDDRPFRELIEVSLKQVDLHTVGTLAAAKDWLTYSRADLILVDLGLPDSRGLDTLRALSHVKAPKVVVTGTVDAIGEAAKLGAVDYITKGDAYEMVERIRFHVNRLSRRQQRFAPHVFEAIKACLVPGGAGELTLVR